MLEKKKEEKTDLIGLVEDQIVKLKKEEMGRDSQR